MVSPVTTQEVKQFIEMNRAGLCIRDIVQLTGRCEKSIRTHLRSMGIDAGRNSHSVRKNAWTFRELRNLVTMYRDGVPIKEIAVRCCRSKSAICMKLYRHVKANRCRPVSSMDIRFIKKHYMSMTSRQMAECLGMTPSNVRMIMAKHALKNSKATNWTEEMVQYITANYADTDNEILEKELGVTRKALTKKAWKLGLKKSAEYMSALRESGNKKWAKNRLLGIEARRRKKAEVPQKESVKQVKKAPKQESFFFKVNPFDVNRTVPMNYVEDVA